MQGESVSPIQFRILFIQVSALAVLAPAPWPYEFYLPFRAIVSISTIFLVVRAVRAKRRWWIFPSLVVAILFAPGLAFTFPKGIWSVFDASAALLFGLAAWDLGKARKVVLKEKDFYSSDFDPDAEPEYEYESNDSNIWVSAIVTALILAFVFGYYLHQPDASSSCTDWVQDERGGYCAG